MTQADLPAIAAEMRAAADARPYNPLALAPPGKELGRWLELDGYRFWVTLTRTNVKGNAFYQLSIGEPALVAEAVIQAVRAAILPVSTDLGELPFSRQFVQRIEG